jgi:DNA-binding NarL/FixJ family response regulator
MLGLSGRILVVAEAATGEEALRLYREHRPDVAIIDLRMPGMGGVALIQAIRAEFPEARMVALSSFTGDEDIHRALEAGALAFLFKTVLADDLIAAVDAAHAGKRRLGPEVMRLLEGRPGGPALTTREREVLGHMVGGLDNETLASTLGITVETVKVHIKRILSKLGVSNRSQAVAVALKRGIAHLD